MNTIRKIVAATAFTSLLVGAPVGASYAQYQAIQGANAEVAEDHQAVEAARQDTWDGIILFAGSAALGLSSFIVLRLLDDEHDTSHSE